MASLMPVSMPAPRLICHRRASQSTMEECLNVGSGRTRAQCTKEWLQMVTRRGGEKVHNREMSDLIPLRRVRLAGTTALRYRSRLLYLPFFAAMALITSANAQFLSEAPSPGTQSDSPSDRPSDLPSREPSQIPSMTPSFISFEPTRSDPPTLVPTASATPSQAPSTSLPPSANPSSSYNPTLQPTTTVPPSQDPTTSLKPSIQPTTSPMPSVLPTDAPSKSSPPSLRPSQSFRPSAVPSTSAPPSVSHSPSTSVAPSVSVAPTVLPTPVPTGTPSIENSQSPTSSAQPTSTFGPSAAPSSSYKPSTSPSLSPQPSRPPSFNPTTSVSPSQTPSQFLSDAPSVVPSDVPSTFPTFQPPIIARSRYRQEVARFPLNESEASILFNETEQVLIMSLYENYTIEFAPDERRVSRVESLCRFEDEVRTIEEPLNSVIEFTCSYISAVEDVSEFPSMFADYINNNLPFVSLDMQMLGLNVREVFRPRAIGVNTPAPTDSREPSPTPTIAPTQSIEPSSVPSFRPSETPSSVPSIVKIPSLEPSTFEATVPTLAPTSRPVVPQGKSDTNVGLIVGITVSIGLLILFGLFLYYRQWKKKRMERLNSTTPIPGRRMGAKNKQGVVPDDHTDGVVVISPSESIVSHKSLLSLGGSGLGDESVDEFDQTRQLQDEFDQYKDQNLELFRADVEANFDGFEEIFSAAVTKAWFGDDDDSNVDPQELMWGFQSAPSGVDVEASALCEVNDWLKRNDDAPMERRLAFMQDLLNRMVTSVRFGVLSAEDASRTVHECGAMLGMQLAEGLSVATLLISGLRKTVEAQHIVQAFREFGDIEVTAVASRQRGFGIVRFRNSKSVDRALRRFRSNEIVVQDVAVNLKVLGVE